MLSGAFTLLCLPLLRGIGRGTEKSDGETDDDRPLPRP
jgi:hypothetical protein